MTVKEIEREIETVDRVAASNTDINDILGHLMRGVWEIALQHALYNSFVRARIAE